MPGIAPIAFASTAFVGSRLALSHPWRRPLAAAFGEGGDLALGLRKKVRGVTPRRAAHGPWTPLRAGP